MNSKVLLHLCSVLLAIGLTTAKSIPDVEEAPEPADLQLESRHQEEVIQTHFAPFQILKELFADVRDKVKDTAVGTRQRVKVATDQLTAGVKSLVQGKLFTKKRDPHEPEVVIVTLSPNAVHAYDGDDRKYAHHKY